MLCFRKEVEQGYLEERGENMTKKICYLFLSALLFSFISSVRVSADDNGGTAGNRAGIEFYENAENSSTTTTEISSNATVVNIQASQKNEQAFFPQTGESNEFSKMIFGLSLIVFILIFSVKKSRKSTN